MRPFKMHLYLSLLLISFYFLPGLQPASAADKIGNGGGVWVCQGPKLEIYDVMFMDVFEGRHEYQLNLPETQASDLETVHLQKKWIAKFLPAAGKILQHIQYAEKNVTWIDDVINTIPDGANKISPHPSTCKLGEWTAVQLVNFTDDFRILVRRELFESTYMSNLERAAVYLHEGIYSYLRTDFNDTNSVRARAVVGYLLSDLADSEKQSRIQKALGQVTPPPPPPPSQGWICGIKPERDAPLYVFEAVTAKLATEGAVSACMEGQNPFGGDFPGMPPGIPGAPGSPGGPDGGFGPQKNCKADLAVCEAVTGAARDKTCSITSPFNQKVFIGTGRTKLEAQKEAMKQCMVVESMPYRCYDSSNLTCN